MKKLLLLYLFASPVVLFSQVSKNGYYNEKYRPQLHFSPAKNWTNDPNGLIYHNGEYHLFYQYNPFGTTWGHMSWGHAVSNDLVKWKHLPVAIPEDKNNMIFSGSCVIDKNNTSGLATAGKLPMVAVYTAHIIPDSAKPDDYRQNQHIAYSFDNGRTWTKYKNNPVLDIGKKDFRDPKVFWYGKDKKWVMAVVLPLEHIVQFYSSPNLKEWTHLSDFGPAGDTKDIWECPDLLEVPVKGKPGEKKWVLINSGQTTMQYFVGEFDGTKFINENPADTILRPDYGADNYAAITYNNLPANHAPVLMGWANNWTYAGAIPTSVWRSAMTLPRELSVEKRNALWTLLSRPVTTLEKYRGTAIDFENMKVVGEKSLPLANQLVEIKMTIRPGKDDSCGIKLGVANDKYFTIGYAGNTGRLYIDRSTSGDTAFHPAYKNWLHTSVPVALKDETLQLHIFFDKSIIEIFANDGDVVLTEQLFADESSNGISITSKNGSSVFESVKIWPLRSAWR